MIEFFRHSGMHHLYASALRQLETAASGASTDLQLSLAPSISTDLVDLLGEGSSASQSALVEFIAQRQMIAIGQAYSQILYNQPVASPGSISPPSISSTTYCRSAFTCTLKLVTINVRSLHDSGKVKFVFSQLASIGADIAFVQETRLPVHFDLPRLDGFHIATLPAEPNRGGLLIAVRDRPEVSVIQEKKIGSR
eukprot:6443764-Amphidinium_carterae.5